MLYIYRVLVGVMLTYIVNVNKEGRKSKQTYNSVILKPYIYGG
jgi:hypothetical protein